jgi:hypothetical protein
LVPGGWHPKEKPAAEAQIAAQDHYAVVLELLNGDAAANLNKAVAARHANLVEQYTALLRELTPEQGAALKKLVAGEGAPRELAQVLMPCTSLLKILPLSDTEHVRAVKELIADEQQSERRRLECEQIRAKPDWSVWNVLSWIAFRDLALLCEIEDKDGLRRVVMWGHPFLKEPAPEPVLMTALKRNELPAIRNGEELPAKYWYGKTKVDRNVWFDRDSVLRLWRDGRWSLAQMMLWIVTRDSQQVEDAWACRLDRAAAAIVIEQRPRKQIENTVKELSRRCLQGALQTFEGPRPIDASEWRDLEISFVEWAPLVRRGGQELWDIGFLPVEALHEFPPRGPAEARAESAQLPPDEPLDLVPHRIEPKKKDAPKKGPIKDAILCDLKNEKTTTEQLNALDRKTLVERYGRGAGRTTVVDALKEALSEFLSRS